jgi:NAD(P)-dependent dehydrogenase (short-subunit alcohol dehydrogenase family)
LMLESVLAGKTAVITGSAQGIGLEIARVFARSGASVVVNDRDLEGAHEAVDELTAGGAAALAVACDVTSESAVEHLVSEATIAFGKQLGLPA